MMLYLISELFLALLIPQVVFPEPGNPMIIIIWKIRRLYLFVYFVTRFGGLLAEYVFYKCDFMLSFSFQGNLNAQLRENKDYYNLNP